MRLCIIWELVHSCTIKMVMMMTKMVRAKISREKTPPWWHQLKVVLIKSPVQTLSKRCAGVLSVSLPIACARSSKMSSRRVAKCCQWSKRPKSSSMKRISKRRPWLVTCSLATMNEKSAIQPVTLLWEPLVRPTIPRLGRERTRTWRRACSLDKTAPKILNSLW